MFAATTYFENSHLSARDTRIREDLLRQHSMTAYDRENKVPFFTKTIVDDVIFGLYVDPQYDELTFVTPRSWIFHAVEFSTICAFSVVCSNTMRAYPTEFVRELVLLEARRPYIHPCMRENQSCNELMAKLDASFQQASEFRKKRFYINGYSSDQFHLNQDRLVDFFEYFGDEFKHLISCDLFEEDENARCALKTHQEGFYFNSLPSVLEGHAVERTISRVRKEVADQEYQRFSALLSAPLMDRNAAGLTGLTEFISSICRKVIVITNYLVDKDVNYQLPMLTTREHAKVILSDLLFYSGPSTTTEEKEKIEAEARAKENEMSKDDLEEGEEEEEGEEKEEPPSATSEEKKLTFDRSFDGASDDDDDDGEESGGCVVM